MKRIWFSMVAAVAMTACGGKVVVDGVAGNGGAGGAGGGASSTPFPTACPADASFNDTVIMGLVGATCIPDAQVCASNNGCGGCSVTCVNGVWTSTNADLCFSVGGAC